MKKSKGTAMVEGNNSMERIPIRKLRYGKAYIEKINVSNNIQKNLKALLENWVWAMEKYIEAREDDIPYWWDENANTGFLAAAAWKMGAIALEQYSVHRRDRSKGHGDLWVTFKNGSDFSIEAKILWNSGQKEQELKDELKEKLSVALKQLRDPSEKGEKGQCKIPLCFLVPETSSKEWIKKRKERFIEVVCSIFKKTKDCFVVSYFPTEIAPSRLKWPKQKNIKRYPGVVLAGFVKRK